MGLKFKYVDHKDRNKTNNQRDNLRIATSSQNNCNVAKRKGSIYSDYKGVSYKRDLHKWFAQIQKHKQKYHIGYFETEIEAALAYNRWAMILHGEFAYLNEVY